MLFWTNTSCSTSFLSCKTKVTTGKKKNLGKIKSEATPIEQPGSHSQAAVKGDEEKPSALRVQKYHKKNQGLGEELLNTRAAHLVSCYKASP